MFEIMTEASVTYFINRDAVGSGGGRERERERVSKRAVANLSRVQVAAKYVCFALHPPGMIPL